MCIEHCTCTETFLPCAIRVLLRMIPQAKASIPVCRAVVVPPCTTVSHRCPARVPPVSRRCPARVPPVSRRCPAVSRRVPPVSRRCPAVSRRCPAGVPPVSRPVPPVSRPVPPCPALSRRVPPLSLAFFACEVSGQVSGRTPGVSGRTPGVSGRTPGVSGRTAPDASFLCFDRLVSLSEFFCCFAYFGLVFESVCMLVSDLIFVVFTPHQLCSLCSIKCMSKHARAPCA